MMLRQAQHDERLTDTINSQECSISYLFHLTFTEPDTDVRQK